MAVTLIPGDLITMAQAGQFDVIVHGCNCWCTMGAGIAKGIRAAFPAAYAADLATKRGARTKLGACTTAVVDTAHGRLTVVNAYTQFHWKGKAPLVDYAALERCMTWVASTYPASRIGLPKIGAGLAGGDWSRILDIIERTWTDRTVTVVEYHQ